MFRARQREQGCTPLLTNVRTKLRVHCCLVTWDLNCHLVDIYFKYHYKYVSYQISTLFQRPRDVFYHWRHVSSSSWTMKDSQFKYSPWGQWWPPSACVPIQRSSGSNDIHPGLHPQRCTTSNSSVQHR